MGMVRFISGYSIAASFMRCMLEKLFFTLYMNGVKCICSFPNVSRVEKIALSYFQFYYVSTQRLSTKWSYFSSKPIMLGLSMKKKFKNSIILSLLWF
jgi:hypothetical protein